MSNANEIKQHLKAVEQTRKITNAMYLLSTSRMKKAMQSIDYNLFYLERLRTTIKDILSKTKNNNLTNKFIEEREQGSAVFVVVTSDKGLCGGYNSSVVNLALEKMAEHENPMVISLGIIGDRLFKNRGIEPAFSWYGASQHPTLNLADQVASKLIAVSYKQLQRGFLSLHRVHIFFCTNPVYQKAFTAFKTRFSRYKS